ncbi:DUF6599 family protein [candidate division CSSED10-310 bacterium]|uniref:DUF6599 family protein n=1 Tax=candidate division CSSED10-310 bacterium TaxID=2855610 RepID=A0ABV6YW45_UNCC1
MMMKRLLGFLLCFAFLPFQYAQGENQTELAQYLPELKDWKADGPAQIFTPQDLFEYINGAAELYLSYDFQKVATVTLENEAEHSLTIDIFQHSNDQNGFGIYSQEKPRTGNFLPVGNEGYYEEGIMNFVRGKFYVKLICFGVEKEKEQLLLSVAREIAAKLPASESLPETLSVFPTSGKVPHSEKYIARNFLGYHFLHSAFVAEYKSHDHEFQLFIIEAVDPDSARTMVKHYTQFVVKNGSKIEQKQGFVRFQDPYHRTHGAMNLQYQGRFIWGLFSDDKSIYEQSLGQVKQKLKEKSGV